MNKKTRFSPSNCKEQESSVDLSMYSEDDVMHARAQVEKEQAKKKTRSQKFEELWAIISTVFAIISTAVLLAKNWVDGALSYVILAMLCLYVLVFLILCALLYRTPTKNISMKAYGKVVKIFKALANAAFLVLSAMSLAGIAISDVSPTKWILFVGNFVLAAVKLGFSLCSLIRFIFRRHVAKKYRVQVTRIVDGKVQKKTAGDVRKEKKYKA